MTHKTNPKHMAIAMIAAIPFAAAIALTDCFGIGSEPHVAEAPVEQIVEAPVVEEPVVVVEAEEPEFKYDWEESEAQYKWFYNFYRNSGLGHGDARGLAEEQLREQGFDYTVVTNSFARRVRLAY